MNNVREHFNNKSIESHNLNLPIQRQDTFSFHIQIQTCLYPLPLGFSPFHPACPCPTHRERSHPPIQVHLSVYGIPDIHHRLARISVEWATTQDDVVAFVL